MSKDFFVWYLIGRISWPEVTQGYLESLLFHLIEYSYVSRQKY